MGIPVADALVAAAMMGGSTAQSLATNLTSIAQITAKTGLAAAATSQKSMSYGQKIIDFLVKKGWMAKKTGQFLSEMATKRAQFAATMATKRAQFALKMAKTVSMFTKFMVTMAKFMPIIQLALILIMIFTNALKYIMMLIAGIIVGFVYVLHYIFGLPGLIYVPIFIYWWISVFIPFVIYCIVYTVILVFVLLFYCIISLVNLAGAGWLQHFLFCENSPSNWHTQPNFHRDNKFKRGFFCSKPCAKGYAPDVTGSYCYKIPKNVPDYCPQAQVMSIYSGKNRTEKRYTYPDYKVNGNIQYLSKPPNERERILFDHFMKGQEFFTICDDKMQPYKNVTLNICSNLDSIERTNLNNMSKADIERLKRVCKQSFCNGKASYPFCSNITATNEEDEGTLVHFIVKFITSLVVFLIILHHFFDMTKD